MQIVLSFSFKQEAHRKSLWELFAQTVFNWVYWGGWLLGVGFSPLNSKGLPPIQAEGPSYLRFFRENQAKDTICKMLKLQA